MRKWLPAYRLTMLALLALLALPVQAVSLQQADTPTFPTGQNAIRVPTHRALPDTADVQPTLALTMTKTVTPDTHVAYHSAVTYTISLVNSGPGRHGRRADHRFPAGQHHLCLLGRAACGGGRRRRPDRDLDRDHHRRRSDSTHLCRHPYRRLWRLHHQHGIVQPYHRGGHGRRHLYRHADLHRVHAPVAAAVVRAARVCLWHPGAWGSQAAADRGFRARPGPELGQAAGPLGADRGHSGPLGLVWPGRHCRRLPPGRVQRHV